MRAYVMIKMKPKKSAQLMQDLKEIEAITEACLVHGEYDCIATLEAKDLLGINNAVIQIRTMKGILDTMTSMIVHSWHHAES